MDYNEFKASIVTEICLYVARYIAQKVLPTYIWSRILYWTLKSQKSIANFQITGRRQRWDKLQKV